MGDRSRLRTTFSTPSYGVQQSKVETPDPAEIDYFYDFSSIFATPEQEKLFTRPYRTYNNRKEDSTDELLRLVGAWHSGRRTKDSSVGAFFKSILPSEETVGSLLYTNGKIDLSKTGWFFRRCRRCFWPFWSDRHANCGVSRFYAQNIQLLESLFLLQMT